MSYCRFGWDNSDVYVYVGGPGPTAIQCCGCHISEQWVYTDVVEFLEHLEEHRKVGHTVPDYVASEIVSDWENGEFAKWDQTRAEEMAPWVQRFESVPLREVGMVEFYERNRHMLGDKADEFIKVLRDEEEAREGRSEAAEGPASERATRDDG